MRSPLDHNKPVGNINEMLLFNDTISNLGLIEIPLKGSKFTWSNMKSDPLLHRLDLFFTSSSWTSVFPSTIASALARKTSDHVPCVISFQSSIPQAAMCRFENRWLEMPGFLPLVQNVWSDSIDYADPAKRIFAKFKILRKELNIWSKTFSSLKEEIADCNAVIALLDSVKNCKNLSDR
jgi:hypothetical protein